MVKQCETNTFNMGSKTFPLAQLGQRNSSKTEKWKGGGVENNTIEGTGQKKGENEERRKGE